MNLRYSFHKKLLNNYVLNDIIKENSVSAIEGLRSAGVKKNIMLTGDSKRVADVVAKELGMDEVYSELLPANKVEQVEALLAGKNEKEKLAFVGDGINDAPVLSRADIGIAMGAMGSDAAIESADMVLSSGTLSALPRAVRIARRTIATVKANITFSLLIKAVIIVLAILSIAPLWLAVFADTGVCLLCVLNAVRLIKS